MWSLLFLKNAIMYVQAYENIYILLMSRLGNWMTGSKNFIIYYKKMIVSHKYSIRGMFAIVAVRKITVALLIYVTITRN